MDPVQLLFMGSMCTVAPKVDKEGKKGFVIKKQAVEFIQDSYDDHTK